MNSGGHWSASFSGHIEILKLSKKTIEKTKETEEEKEKEEEDKKENEKNGVVDISTSFTNVRNCVSINEFIPVANVLNRENGFLSDDGNDTIKVKFILRPLNAVNPEKIISKKAAALAKERLSNALKGLNESLDAFLKCTDSINTSKTKAIERFKSLSQNVIKYADIHSTTSEITARYAKLEEDIKSLELRENALLGKADAAASTSEDAQKLLETIDATSKLLSERLENAPDDVTEDDVKASFEKPPFVDDGKEVKVSGDSIPGSKSDCLSFSEAWDSLIVEGYKVIWALSDCGIALEEVCYLNEAMRAEYSKMAEMSIEKKKEIDKLGPYRQSVWDKWTKLKRTVGVLEGDKEIINTLTRAEAEKFIEMAEEAQENFKAAGMK